MVQKTGKAFLSNRDVLYIMQTNCREATEE